MKPSSCGLYLIAAALCTLPAVALASGQTVTLESYERSVPGLSEVSRLGHSGRLEEAVQLLDLMKENSVECSPDHLPSGVADFMAARLYENAGNHRRAIERYRAAAASPLGDLASWRLGGLLLKTGDVSGARTAFGSVSSASSVWIKARTALASSLMDEGRFAAAAAVLNGMLETDVQEPQLSEVRLAGAAAVRLSGDAARALAMVRLVYFTGDSRGASAAFRMLGKLGHPIDALLKSLRQVSRAGRRELRSLDVLARKRPLSLARLDPAMPFVVRAAFVLASDGDPHKALHLLESAMGVCGNADVEAFIFSLRGEALVESGDDAGAARAWSRVVEEHPGSPFAPDAGYSGARAFMRTGSHAQAVSLLRKLQDSVPVAGSTLSLRWELALAALMARDYPEALSALDGILAITDHGEGLLFGPAERARYFRGVTLYMMGERDEASLDLMRVARSSEYSWYGILARSRLNLWYGQEFRGVVSQPPETGRFIGGLRTAPRDADWVENARPAVGARGVGPVFLYRMGDAADAEAELVASARHGLLEEGDLNLLAMLKASDPDPAKAMRAASWLRADFDADSAWVYAAAYPRPFAEYVEDASARFDVDPALVYGVMRAESNFRPAVRSPAGAYGLMQIMRPTARTVMRDVLAPVGVRVSFQKPSGNVMVGTALLDQLIVHFDGYLPLVLGAYNAGSGSGRKFMRRLGHLPTDLLVEAVPYAETREYIKRVAGFAGAYRYLYGNSVPLRVVFEAPSKTGPWLDVTNRQRHDPDVVADPLGECRDDTRPGAGLRSPAPPAPAR